MSSIKSINLPKDNGPHDFTVEWWYFNGHLKDVYNNEYSFMDCFFKVNLNKVKIPHLAPHLLENIFSRGEYIHFAHSVVSDISKNRSYKEIQNISLISEDSFKKGLLYINYRNAHLIGENLNGEIDEISPNNFHLKNKHIDLILNSKKAPLLEGGHGYVGTPKAGSYYYSYTNMDVIGKINIKGKDVEVKGQAWMDHQWADATYKDKGKKDKWTWFSFNLENGTDIMCVEYDTEIGSTILVDIIDRNSNQTQFNFATFIPIGKSWKSRETKAKYPLSWRIEIPEANIVLLAKSQMKDQEMIFGAINYWEGQMKVEAIIEGEKVEGRGFMELVGYPSDYNYLKLKEKEIQKNFFKKIRKLFLIKS